MSHQAGRYGDGFRAVRPQEPGRAAVVAEAEAVAGPGVMEQGPMGQGREERGQWPVDEAAPGLRTCSASSRLTQTHPARRM